MHERGRRLDLPLKAPHRVRRPGRGQDLQRHHAIHLLMQGFVDPAHSPLADRIQDDVIAEDQPLGVLVTNRLGLKRRELLLVNHAIQEGVGGVAQGRRRQLPAHRIRLFRRHQAAIDEQKQQLVRGLRPGAARVKRIDAALRIRRSQSPRSAAPPRQTPGHSRSPGSAS